MKNWIPIREDYIIDNLDSLLESFTEADFRLDDDELLTESINRLDDVAESLLTNFFTHNLGITIPIDEEFIRNVRIILTSIYVSVKSDIPAGKKIISLLNTLAVNGLYQDESSLDKIRQTVVNLAVGNPIETLPYNLRDLAPETFDLPLFVQKLLGIKFQRDGEGNGIAAGYQSKGSFLIDGDAIGINTVGLNELSEKNLKPIADLTLDVTLYSEEKKKLADMDFKEQVVTLNRMIQSAAEVSDMHADKLKIYTEDNVFFVKVVNVNHSTGWVKCRTIDPSYEELELYLDILLYDKLNPYVTINRTDITGKLLEGTVLKVKIKEKGGRQYFELSPSVRDYYRNLDNFTDNYSAVFVEEYKGGTRWVTEMGHIVNVMHNSWDNEIAEAAEKNCTLGIEVSNLNSRVDGKGNTVINGERIGTLFDEMNHDEFRQEIPSNLVDSLLQTWQEECPVYRSREELHRKFKLLTALYPRTIGNLLGILAYDASLPFHIRYYNAAGSKLLALMTGDPHDEAYSDFTMTYLRALWAFAQDTGHDWLSTPTVPDEIEGVESVEKGKDIVEILTQYRDEHHIAIPTIGTEIDLDRLRNLVDASNALSGNIAESELNRIKRTICQYLGISSIYKEEASDKYFFGEESDMLEFKTSIVFPPTRTGEIIANPDVQIWQILKTVNGFLNSLHGGTLLIGVNDFGNANGLESDITWLFDNHQILSPDIDKYLLYIKLRLDNAFEAYRRNDRDSDITSTRLRYSTSRAEEKTVLRIDILPFELGCVKMKEKLKLPTGAEIKRPAYIRDAYVRTANTTEELTIAIRKKIEGEKRGIIKDAEQQKYITVQEAIELNRYVTLKDYQSYRGDADKTVMPVELLPQRGLLVGAKKGEKDLKVFKLSRCETVELTDESFRPAAHRYSYSVDPFNTLALGKKLISIHLRLDRTGWLLIREAHPYAANPDFLTKDNEDPDFPYSLKCDISNIIGIGSFCLSIMGHFRIVEGTELDAFIREKIADYLE